MFLFENQEYIKETIKWPVYKEIVEEKEKEIE